jgi:hypothetical protein
MPCAVAASGRGLLATTKAGDESDAALAKIITRSLDQASAAIDVPVVGVTHFGKQVDTGSRGSSVFEDDADTVLALVRERALLALSSRMPVLPTEKPQRLKRRQAHAV